MSWQNGLFRLWILGTVAWMILWAVMVGMACHLLPDGKMTCRTVSNHWSAEWIDRLNTAGVPCGPIYAIDQMFADPQVQHLGLAQPVKKKDKSVMRLVSQPMTLSRTPSRFVAPPPACGEHTNAVLKEFGFNAKEIAALRKALAI